MVALKAASLSLIVLGICPALAAANGAIDPASCHRLASEIERQHAGIAELQEARDAAALAAEDAGEVWEELEIHRLVSAAHAARADAGKAAFEAERATFTEREATLQAAVAALNADIRAFNARCATR